MIQELMHDGKRPEIKLIDSFWALQIENLKHETLTNYLDSGLGNKLFWDIALGLNYLCMRA